MRVDSIETKELSAKAFIDTRTSRIQGVLYCRVLEDLILFRSIRCNQVFYLYFPLSFGIRAGSDLVTSLKFMYVWV
jgi:hypothetical protein